MTDQQKINMDEPFWKTATLTELQDRAFLIHWITDKIMERSIEVDLQPNPENQPWDIEYFAKKFCEHLTKEQLDGWCEVERAFDELIEHKGDVG